jgi:hypothetical protein
MAADLGGFAVIGWVARVSEARKSEPYRKGLDGLSRYQIVV